MRDEVENASAPRGSSVVARKGSSALVDPAWLQRRRNDPKVKLIEIAGTGQDEMQVTRRAISGSGVLAVEGHAWDLHRREFPAPEDFARRWGAAGIGNDTTVVFYRRRRAVRVYAWWTFATAGTRTRKFSMARAIAGRRRAGRS
jgi:3-mercaptopyruvate sulfurtransferase SseA